MNKKNIVLILFICAQAISLLGIVTKTASVNQQQPKAQISYEQKLQATCDYMQKELNAYLCTDTALLEKFNAIQKDLNIDPIIPLFFSKHSPQSLGKCNAYYAPFTGIYTPCVCIVTPNFDRLSELGKIWFLAHELRHHLQHIDYNIQQALDKYVQQGMSYKQAKEHDADAFGIQYATKNCPCCLQELQHPYKYDSLAKWLYYFAAMHWVTGKKEEYHGYFQWHDFNALIKKAEHNPVYCNKHIITKRPTTIDPILQAFKDDRLVTSLAVFSLVIGGAARTTTLLQKYGFIKDSK